MGKDGIGYPDGQMLRGEIRIRVYPRIDPKFVEAIPEVAKAVANRK
jgi:hypothetical protein